MKRNSGILSRFKDAVELIGMYGHALEVACARGIDQIASSESELPATKAKILQAFKFEAAYRIWSGELDKKLFSFLAVGTMHLERFVSAHQAKQINAYRAADRDEVDLTSADDFSRWMANLDRMVEEKAAYAAFMAAQLQTRCAAEFSEFVENVRKLDRSDPLFWQRVYTMLDLPFEPS